MASRYELFYLVSAQITETDLPQITGRVAEMITKLGGQVVKDELWGKRKLTYQIGRDHNAYFWLTQYDTVEPINAAITEQLNLQPEIIRVLITEALPDSETVPMEQARQEAAVRQEERTAKIESAKSAAMIKPVEIDSESPIKSSKIETDIAELKPIEAPAKPAEASREDKRIDMDELDRKLDELLDEDIKGQ
jgi:small subunit ribosomal protein S6